MIDEENGSGRSLLLISLRSHPGCGSADEAAGDTCGFSGDVGFRAIRILGVFAIFEEIFPNFSDISVKISLISEKSLVSPTFLAEQRCFGGFYFTAIKRFRTILHFFQKHPILFLRHTPAPHSGTTLRRHTPTPHSGTALRHLIPAAIQTKSSPQTSA